MNGWAQLNSDCNVAIEYDETDYPHIYSTCTCDKLQPHSDSGISVTTYTFDQKNGDIFSTNYPTSSPYGMVISPINVHLIIVAVTSVGGTQFKWKGNNIVGEIGASVKSGARITTGGGFSNFHTQPSYQASAVASYLSSGVALPPSFSYDPSMRAYPDISFSSHNYEIFYSTNTDDLNTCPCVSLSSLFFFYNSL